MCIKGRRGTLPQGRGSVKRAFGRERRAGDSAPNRCGGFALTEFMFASGITTLLVLVVCAFSFYSSRNFVTLSNYVELDDLNRLAIDQLTTDLRQANRVASYTTDATSNTTNSIVLEDSDGQPLVYSYSPGTRTLTRTKGSNTKVLLTECDFLKFSLGQRNPIGASYDVYPAADQSTAKVVNISWLCSRSIFGIKATTESVQTARIVIRRQGT